jgi:HSP90 family molecular chaperone
MYWKRQFLDEDYDLVPQWLDFVYAAVDKGDLPSRYFPPCFGSSYSRCSQVIRKHLVEKSLELFHEAVENKDQFKSMLPQVWSCLIVSLL